MRTTLLTLALATGCSTVSPAAPVVRSGGTRIYMGNVFGADGTQMFRYTRDSQVNGPVRSSIHRSYDAEDGQLVVAQVAEHDASFELDRYVEDHGQLGILSEVVVEDGKTLAFTTHKDGRTRYRTERLRAPVVTGPTLFGFVSAHWDQLSSGEAIAVRFVVAERRRSYAFTLKMAPSASGQTVVTMHGDSLIVRLSTPAMHMTFDSRTRTITRYEGRIPPRWKGRPVDARVEYEHDAPYR